MDKVFPDDAMERLKMTDPEAHRVMTALTNARRDEYDTIPEPFAYVRALQDYDKEHGNKVSKGQYANTFREYQKAVQRNNEEESFL
jgi:hypothetical protein